MSLFGWLLYSALFTTFLTFFMPKSFGVGFIFMVLFAFVVVAVRGDTHLEAFFKRFRIL